MKVRKLAVALALAGGLGSGIAQALGLGEIELQSFLNEPLSAEITLRKSEGVSPTEVFVSLASEADYNRVGIDRGYFLSRLKFDVAKTANGNLVVNVSSREALREPYLNFLLEVTWPSGRLMREYAVLVDPPVYAESSGVRESVQAPQTTSPAPSARTTSSTTRQADTRSSRPSIGSPRPTARTYGATGAADTLWAIAIAVRPDSSVTPQQVMLALQDLNPDAFIGGNINRLKRGEVLRIPDLDQIQRRTRAEASRQVTAQNQALTKPAPTRVVDATEQVRPEVSDTGSGVAQGGELRLLVAGDDADAREAGSAGGDGQLSGGSDSGTGTAIALEELESARRENTDLSDRVTDLQDQVATLQRLLELKNSQLADIQGLSAETSAPESAEGLTEAGGGTGEIAGELAATDIDPVAADESTEAVSTEIETTDVVSAGTDVAQTEMSVEEQVESPAGMQPVASSVAAAEDKDSQVVKTPEPKPAVEQDRGLVGSIIHAITNNSMYQLAVGAGLIVLLLLLLLLARRNANREKVFYEQLNREADEGTDAEGADDDSSEGFSLALEEEDAAPKVEKGETSDALAEADAYIAYGRLDKAMQALETAISREPSRTDLRVRLLGVYAETQDRSSFEKQFSELEALGSEQALAEAQAIREQLDESESVPSIDELESQLLSDSFTLDLDELVEDKAADPEPEVIASAVVENAEEAEEDELSLSGLGDLSFDDEDAGSESGPDQPIEYDLSGIVLDGEPAAKSGEDEGEASLDFSDLEIAFDTDDLGDADSSEVTEDDFATLNLDDDSFATRSPESLVEEFEETGQDELGVLGSDDEQEPSFELSDDSVLDESFLDELDAELEKVTSENADEVSSLFADSALTDLDDLELDVTDEDLALLEEVSEGVVTDDADAQLLEDDLELDELLSEIPIAADTIEDQESEVGAEGAPAITESDIGDDEEDFDFLDGTDEAATKLDLARAYVEMGDSEGAKDILDEVAIEGSDEQKAEAQELLKNLS